MTSRVIPDGSKFLSPDSAAKKFDRGRSWLWDRVKNDETFPKPIYIDDRAPLFVESELDDWVRSKAL